MQMICTNNAKIVLVIQNSTLQMTEGERVRKIRGIMTYADFSAPLGVGGSNISNIEKGRSRLSLELAIKIAQVYEVSLDWLLLDKGPQLLSEPKVEYNEAKMTFIDKDELIELQRLALKNTIKEKDKQIESLKNN
ncbi:MAG: family transcriptional regulator [Chitinophagaceae bacterium]|nr:family transcriptional regulator [Chitinophagaceae bacterium]